MSEEMYCRGDWLGYRHEQANRIFASSAHLQVQDSLLLFMTRVKEREKKRNYYILEITKQRNTGGLKWGGVSLGKNLKFK
jgi:hypothetical protein